MSHRITPSAHELLRDLHGIVAGHEQASLALSRVCRAYEAGQTSLAAVTMAEAILNGCEQRLVNLSRLLAIATPQCRSRHSIA